MQQTSGQRKRPKKAVQDCFKKGWKSLKFTFSGLQNNKVTPVSIKCDLDQSDPQPGPSHQQSLHVFKPAVLQDPVLPGCCNLEEIPVDDPVHPQPGPSGLEETAGDPDARQAELQTSWKKKKKGFCATLRKRWQAMKQTFSSSGKDNVLLLASQPKPDQADPQTAPEEPAEHQQPEQPTSGNKKKGVTAHLKKRWKAFRRTSSPTPNNEVVSLPVKPTPKPYSPKKTSSTIPVMKYLDANGTFLSRYEVGEQLGAGSFGVVHQGTRRSDGLKVAIKFFFKMVEYINMPGHDEGLPKEVGLNMLLHKPEKCPNIVQMLEWFEDRIMFILILEYPQPCVTLREFINQQEDLSENQAGDFMRQVVNAIDHCIKRNVHHNDTHWANILINTETMELKLIDFGCGVIASTYGEPGTANYGLPYAVSHTVHRLGTLLKNMMKWKEPDQVVSDECKDLISLCHTVLRTRGPTLEEVLEHKWFKQT